MQYLFPGILDRFQHRFIQLLEFMCGNKLYEYHIHESAQNILQENMTNGHP